MVKIAFFKELLEIPAGVKVTVDENNHVTVQGPKGGPITKDFSHAAGIKITIEGNKIYFSTNFPKGLTLALVKTLINIINNLIIGVQTNYKYLCKICYSHFPFSCSLAPETNEILVSNFLGEKAPRRVHVLDTVNVKIEGDDIILTGPDKEKLGQTAANLKKACRIKKKDPRVFQDGIYAYKVEIGDKILWQIK